MARIAIYTLFFLSGACALAYEVLWQRALHLVLGVSTPAVSVVLAAFMGGLALGGLLLGPIADRATRPQRWYAGLEAAIGLSALLVPIGLAGLTRVHDALFQALRPGPMLTTALRLALALLVLLVPATLIGGTVPFMARLVGPSRGRRGDGFSLLYGVNTLGAVVGAALTGMVLLRHLGSSTTLGLAVGVNLFVALASLCLRDGPPTLPEPVPATSAARSGRARLVLALVVAAASGLATTGLEVAWTRVLGVFTSNSAYAFALVLSVVLLGLAVGGLLQSLWARWPGDRWARLAACLAGLAGTTLLALPYYQTPPAWLQRCCTGTPMQLFLGELAVTAGALLVPAILMGLGFPLLVAEVAERMEGRGRWLGRVYAVNTLGCVVGAVLAGFVLVPRLGLHATFGIIIALVALAAVAAGLAAARPGRLVRVGMVLGLVVVLGIGWKRLPDGRCLKSAVVAPRQLLYYREGDTGTVTVIEEANGTRSVMVDGQPVAGTAASSVVDQKMLAHLPLLLHPAPRRALTVGFGSGGTSHSMMLHGVAVDCVEIERAVPDAAGLFLSENAGVRSDPGFHLVIDDARSWLRVAPEPYDAIVTDCTNLQYKSSGDLYTVEYFDLMRQRLTADGVAAAWVPANGIAPADLRVLLRSFRAVFPHTSIWHMNRLPTDFLIVVGTPGPLSIDLGRLAERMASPAVRDDLRTVGLEEPGRLLATCLACEGDLDGYLALGPLHTDDRPVLSYSTYGAAYRSTIAANLTELLAVRGGLAHHVHGGADPLRMLRDLVASNAVELGHIAVLRGEVEQALVQYTSACQLWPEDDWLKAQVARLWLGP